MYECNAGYKYRDVMVKDREWSLPMMGRLLMASMEEDSR